MSVCTFIDHFIVFFKDYIVAFMHMTSQQFIIQFAVTFAPINVYHEECYSEVKRS